MPKRTEKIRQFNLQWIKESWAEGWLIDATQENSLHNAFCKVCKSYIRAHKSDLLRHTERATHKNNMKSLVPDIKQQKLTDKSHITIIANDDKKTKLLLAVYIALHSSIHIDHLTDVYNRISKNKSISFIVLSVHF
ncbi:uncharacterized protein LOC112588409 [Harpegnathos saltator]|uniref:Uncharacterized protein n=1 Tax=Harpegnathos saltator TaxID=610380 RepID=E2B461_HARSA|nr:uncharacterized protein LOC112588409 [Harpegnathos saltator]EFN89520.1 hypothetical protein EAI_03070 [Harpegnathos saltator]